MNTLVARAIRYFHSHSHSHSQQVGNGEYMGHGRGLFATGGRGGNLKSGANVYFEKKTGLDYVREVLGEWLGVW